jgi:hypothetical protein
MDRNSASFKSEEFKYLILWGAIGSLYLAGKLNEGLQIPFDEF